MGYESKRDEPLPFQIINVSSISIHPDYNQGHGGYDLATLHLNSPIIFDLHINPLCLPDSKYLSRNDDRSCISTGWGKSILQGSTIRIYTRININIKHLVNSFSREPKNPKGKYHRVHFPLLS